MSGGVGFLFKAIRELINFVENESLDHTVNGKVYIFIRLWILFHTHKQRSFDMLGSMKHIYEKMDRIIRNSLAFDNDPLALFTAQAAYLNLLRSDKTNIVEYLAPWQ